MHFFIKGFIAILLLISLMLSTALFLTSCNAADDQINSGNGTDPNPDADNTDKDDTDGDKNSGNDIKDGHIVVPEYKDYERGTVNFKDISYKRPDFDAVIGAINSVTEIISANAVSFEEQIAAVEALEPDYANVLTMYSFANIYNSKDASVTYWNEEYSYVSTNYPSFVDAIEEMFVAAANSPHAEKFEADYFGEGLIEEYRDGGTYTDEMIALWSEEESLEARYSSLSTATVTVTYNGKEDTVDNILAYYADKFGINSQKYNLAYVSCMDIYEEAMQKIADGILVDLFKVRRRIANELDCDSYIEYAYSSYNRDYTPQQMSQLLDDIAEYALPVYITLNHYIFQNYFKINTSSELDISTLINNGYFMTRELNDELHEIYSYMLQHGLYDIAPSETNRLDGAFTAYLETYNAPFIFVTAYESTTDYSTLFHEFGHFAESYINYGSQASLDAAEVSSQGLEYIMLHHFGDFVSDKDKQFLKYTALENALTTLIFQGFYAKFELFAYSIPEGDISKETLDDAVVAAARCFSLNTEVFSDISYVNIPHIYISPLYVQSYCTSVIPALELFFTEGNETGKGIELYKSYLHLVGKEGSFIETLTQVGLASPFDKGIVQSITDEIYYEIVGTHYFGKENDNSNAA